jgi:hypothetical protein
MMHTHRCRHCRQVFECDGDQFLNPDGDPVVVCNRFHEHGFDQCPSCSELDAAPPADPIAVDDRDIPY